jgi:hypothetical protein
MDNPADVAADVRRLHSNPRRKPKREMKVRALLPRLLQDRLTVAEGARRGIIGGVIISVITPK